MKRADLLIGGSLFVLALAAYLSMLCPTVYWEDSGELIAAAYSLGIAHPPGHPLWVVLGRAFSLLPFGGVAFRVNLASAFFASSTMLVVYFAVLVLLLHTIPPSRPPIVGDELRYARTAALGASVAVGFSGTFWFYSEISEVYTLLGFFCSVLLLLTLLWKAKGRPVLLIAFSYLYGLALTNNVILLALLPAFLYFFIAHHTIQPSNHLTIEQSNHPTIQRSIYPSIYLSMVLAFLLGLSLYLYLPIRSRLNPYLDWGNPQTLPNLIGLLCAREFAPQFLSLSLTAPGGPLRGMLDHFSQLPRQFGYAGLALGLLGVFSLFRREKRVLLFVILGVLLSIGFAVLAGGGPDLPAYFIPSYLFFSLLIGMGSFELLRRLRKSVVVPLLLLIILIPSLTLHLEENNQRGRWEARRHATNLSQTLSPNGVLFTENTVDCFLLWYLQGVEGCFPGQLAIYTPLLKEEWYREKLELRGLRLPEKSSLVEFAQATSRPVYYTPGEYFLIDPADLGPNGIVFRVARKPSMERHSRLLKVFGYAGSSSERVKKHYSLVHSRLGEYFHRVGMVKDAISEYEKAAQIDEGNPKIFQNLGILYQQEGDLDSARKNFEKAVMLGSRDTSPYLNLGVMALRSGDLAQAVGWLRRSLKVGETPKAYYHLGICYVNWGDVERGIEMTKRAVALEPNFPDAHNNLGVLYYGLGEYEKALAQFRRALELNPDYSQARYNLELLRKKVQSF